MRIHFDTIGVIWVWFATAGTDTPALSGQNPSAAASPASPAGVTAADWEELRTARQTAVEKNPEIAKKSAQLAERMQAFETKLDAAMIKAEPQIAPVVARLHNHGNATSNHPTSTAPAH